NAKRAAPEEPPVSLSDTNFLATQTQSLNQRLIAFEILALEVVQQLTTLVEHANQATTRVVVLLVGLEVVLQTVDVGAKQGNLYFRGTGVTVTTTVFLDDFSFLFGGKCLLSLH